MEQLVAAIDAAVSGSGYSCKPVSWEDCSRGTIGGKLSCWGSNISDVRIWNKDGSKIYVLRSDNFNEKLCVVDPDKIAVVVGNEKNASELRSITLKDYLNNLDRRQKYGAYAGIKNQSKECHANSKITLRFQTVFLPIDDKQQIPNFCTEVYNYQSMINSRPRNLLLLCTPQGTSVQQDGAGAKKVFYHLVDEKEVIHRRWLEAEASRHKVGGSQVETESEEQAARQRGKATAMHIGIPAMEKRFNVQMLIQLPISQAPKKKKQRDGERSKDYRDMDRSLDYSEMECSNYYNDLDDFESEEEDNGPSMLHGNHFCCAFGGSTTASSPVFGQSRSASPSFCFGSKIGTSNAARVSYGEEEDTWSGLTVKHIERNVSQPITITVTLYYTVAEGLPKPEDVKAAITDLEALYGAAASLGEGTTHLSSDPQGVTTELTVNDTQVIAKKLKTQPYHPKPFSVSTASPFARTQ